MNTNFRVPLYIFVVFLLISLACGGNIAPGRVENVENESISAQLSEPTKISTSVSPNQSAMSVIPEDVTYTIINEDIVPQLKRGLNINTRE